MLEYRSTAVIVVKSVKRVKCVVIYMKGLTRSQVKINLTLSGDIVKCYKCYIIAIVEDCTSLNYMSDLFSRANGEEGPQRHSQGPRKYLRRKPFQKILAIKYCCKALHFRYIRESRLRHWSSTELGTLLFTKAAITGVLHKRYS